MTYRELAKASSIFAFVVAIASTSFLLSKITFGVPETANSGALFAVALVSWIFFLFAMNVIDEDE